MSWDIETYEKGTTGLGNLGAFGFRFLSNSIPPISAQYKYGTFANTLESALPFLCHALLPAGRAEQYSIPRITISLSPIISVKYESADSLKWPPAL